MARVAVESVETYGEGTGLRGLVIQHLNADCISCTVKHDNDVRVRLIADVFIVEIAPVYDESMARRVVMDGYLGHTVSPCLIDRVE